MLKNHSKYGDNIGYGRFKLRLPVLRLGFWLWAFHSRSVMTRAFIWHQKVKFANLQLPNVMLKDHDSSSNWCGETHVVERRRGRVLGEVDGLEVDDVVVVGEAVVRPVLLPVRVDKGDRVDPVFDGIINNDAENGLSAQRRVDGERALGRQCIGTGRNLKKRR